MTILNLLIFLFCVSCSIIFGIRIERDGTELEYQVTSKKQCSVSGTVIRHYVGVALDECVYQSFIRSNCDLIKYKRKSKLCELHSYDNGEGITDTRTKGCVAVLRSDIIVLKLADTPASCDVQEEECLPKECVPFRLENGHVTGNMYGVGAQLRIQCNDIYQEASRIKQVTCLPNGSWSHDPVCVQVCPSPPEQDNAVISSGEVTLHSERTYSCKEGYRALDETVTMVTRCTEESQWTPTHFTCFRGQLFYCPNNYDYSRNNLYDSGVRVDSKSSITFQTKGHNDAHVLLQNSRGDEINNVIEIVLGGFGNTLSFIRNTKQGPNMSTQSGPVLSSSAYTWLWISWSGGCVKVGKGKGVGSSVIMTWCGLSHTITAMSISYGFGSDGYFIFVTDCLTPEEIANGSRSYTGVSEGSAVTYDCNDGYTITSGSASRTCSSGVWTGSQPACGVSS